jgi:hypothetical protein
MVDTTILGEIEMNTIVEDMQELINDWDKILDNLKLMLEGDNDSNNNDI